MKHVRRGQIWMCDLGINRGSEQRGLRPCIVLNTPRRKERTVFIVPASNTIRYGSCEVFGFTWLIHQSRVVDTSRFIRLISIVPKEVTDDILRYLFLFLQK